MMLTFRKIEAILTLIQKATRSKADPTDLQLIMHTGAEILHLGALVEQTFNLVEISEKKLKEKRGTGKSFIDNIPNGTSVEEILIFQQKTTSYKISIMAQNSSMLDTQLDLARDQLHRTRLLGLLRYGYRAFGNNANSRKLLDTASSKLFASTQFPSSSASGASSSTAVAPPRAPFANLQVMGGGNIDPGHAYGLDQSAE